MLAKTSMLFGLNSTQRAVNRALSQAPVRNFGIMQEYNERRNKKLINNF